MQTKLMMAVDLGTSFIKVGVYDTRQLSGDYFGARKRTLPQTRYLYSVWR